MFLCVIEKFHLQNISPSGWIEIQKYNKVPKALRQTTVDLELLCNFKDVISLPEKEDSVPYKICSFDIEASSSHGDFPNAIKDYRKVYQIRKLIKFKKSLRSMSELL